MTDPTFDPANGTDPASLANQNPANPGPHSGIDDTAEVALLRAKVQELEAQVQKMTELAGRAQADLQNARTRMEKDAKDIRQFAGESVLLKLLPTIDNFQRAFQHLPDELKNHDWVKGMLALEQDFLRQLADLGLARMESLGAEVDPHRHEVLSVAEGDEGKVIEVFEEGYELHGKVVRPAKVKAGGGKIEN